MKNNWSPSCICLLALILFSTPSFAQIEVGINTLPQIGDELEYGVFIHQNDTLSYRNNGEGLTWSYSINQVDSTELETYADIQGTALQDSFPTANMSVDVLGIESAARRTTTRIDILGFNGGPLGLFGGGTTRFSNPFTFKQVPINYQDNFQDDVSFALLLSSSLIPGLDSIMPFPGASIDSIRITFILEREEEATAWGTLNIQGQDVDVLKIEQIDRSDTKIEVGVAIGGTIVTWLDASAFLGGDIGGLDITKTYKFLSADSKESIIEFTENRVPVDTFGNEELQVSGRIKASLVTSTRHLEPIDGLALSPSPTTGIINIRANEDIMGYRYSVYSLEGKVLTSGYLESRTLNFNQLPQGSYILELQSNSSKGQITFIKL